MSPLKALFQPRSSRFYVLFANIATNLSGMEQVFHQFVYENNLSVNKTQLKTIEELEHANDLTTHKLIIELGRNFITPFDREDIHALASGLDDIADYMYAIARQRISYGIGAVPRETQQIAEKIKLITKLLHEILNSLNTKDLIKLSVLGKEISVLLHQGDHIIDTAMSHLFKQQKDALYVIKLTDHFGLLQKLLDKCGDAVNVIDSIVIKYS